MVKQCNRFMNAKLSPSMEGIYPLQKWRKLIGFIKLFDLKVREVPFSYFRHDSGLSKQHHQMFQMPF